MYACPAPGNGSSFDFISFKAIAFLPSTSSIDQKTILDSLHDLIRLNPSRNEPPIALHRLRENTVSAPPYNTP